MILHDLMRAMPGLVPIGAGVALLVLLGRDPKAADEHTVDDYQPSLAPSRRDWPLLDRQPGGPRRLRPVPAEALDILPPAPPGTTTRLPLYAETVVDQQLRQYGDSPEDIARRMLRDIAAEAQAKAGIRPAYDPDRDMTGAFPVVRVAA